MVHQHNGKRKWNTYFVMSNLMTGIGDETTFKGCWLYCSHLSVNVCGQHIHRIFRMRYDSSSFWFQDTAKMIHLHSCRKAIKQKIWYCPLLTHINITSTISLWKRWRKRCNFVSSLHFVSDCYEITVRTSFIPYITFSSLKQLQNRV